MQLVRCNNVAAGALAANHLADLGHTRIAFAGGPEHSIDSKHRLRGLREGARGARDPPRSESRLRLRELGGQRRHVPSRRPFSTQPLRSRPIVLANDVLAFGFMRVAQQRGIKMPQDLSIVGFDGLPEGALFYPALTTISQPMREMGRVACRRLFEAIEDPAGSRRPSSHGARRAREHRAGRAAQASRTAIETGVGFRHSERRGPCPSGRRRGHLTRAGPVDLFLLILFVASGAAALIYEIVWFQMLPLVIGSSFVSFGTVLARSWAAWGSAA